MKSFVTMFTVCCLLAMVGCGGGKDDKPLAQRAGEKLGESAVDFVGGVSKGVDEKMALKMELSKILSDRGVYYTTAKPNLQAGKTISVYLLTKTPLKGSLITKAVDKKGNEVGRATAEVDFGKDDAKFIDFKFDSRLDTQLVDKYLIGIEE